MKKTISILVVTVLLAAAFGVSVFAADTVNVTVTIWDRNGSAAVALEALSVTDTDNDNKLSVGDVLSAAHDKWYNGGSAAGYACEETEFGLSMTMLWGDSSGSYGYYVNNQMAMSLADEVKDGDYIAAFVYTDKKNLSDTYSFIEFCPDKSASGQNCFIAQYIGWDENWNPVTNPVVGANVFIDGKDSGMLTDENGYIHLSLDEVGEHIITIGSQETPYACGICRFSVNAAENTSESESTSDTQALQSTPDTETDTASAASDTQTAGKEHAAQTGDASLTVSLLLTVCALSAVFVLKKREN